MPRTWYDRHAVNQMEDGDIKNMYRRLLADKKPYFMRYIYPDLMRQYNEYTRSAERKAMREFDRSISEIEVSDNKPDGASDFLRYYHNRMPVGMNDCVMNRICRMFETAFDSSLSRSEPSAKFDYRQMKSGAKYTPRQFYAILSKYNEYNQKLQSYAMFAKYERPDADDSYVAISCMKDEFARECFMQCQNKYALCDILLDICYKHNSTKRFVWDICADTIVENLLCNNNYEIRYPALDDDGYITYCGDAFAVKKVEVDVGDEYCFE